MTLGVFLNIILNESHYLETSKAVFFIEVMLYVLCM